MGGQISQIWDGNGVNSEKLDGAWYGEHSDIRFVKTSYKLRAECNLSPTIMILDRLNQINSLS